MPTDNGCSCCDHSAIFLTKVCLNNGLKVSTAPVTKTDEPLEFLVDETEEATSTGAPGTIFKGEGRKEVFKMLRENGKAYKDSQAAAEGGTGSSVIRLCNIL